MEQTIEQMVAEQATGCRGAGDYAIWAEQQGYPHCHVYDWTSSAGDWTFLVSKDREVWYLMSQDNNYPRPGFSRSINEEEPYEGTFEEACAEVTAKFG